MISANMSRFSPDRKPCGLILGWSAKHLADTLLRGRRSLSNGLCMMKGCLMQLLNSFQVDLHCGLGSLSGNRQEYCEVFRRQGRPSLTVNVYPFCPRNLWLESMTRTIYLFVFAVMVFCFLPSPLSATTYYVAPSGNDKNPGSDLKPFLTLQKAADSTFPGDVVIARDGVYTSSSGLLPN